MTSPSVTPAVALDVYEAAIVVANRARTVSDPDLYLAVGRLLEAIRPLRPAVEHERAARAWTANPTPKDAPDA